MPNYCASLKILFEDFAAKKKKACARLRHRLKSVQFFFNNSYNWVATKGFPFAAVIVFTYLGGIEFMHCKVKFSGVAGGFGDEGEHTCNHLKNT